MVLFCLNSLKDLSSQCKRAKVFVQRERILYKIWLHSKIQLNIFNTLFWFWFSATDFWPLPMVWKYLYFLFQFSHLVFCPRPLFGVLAIMKRIVLKAYPMSSPKPCSRLLVRKVNLFFGKSISRFNNIINTHTNRNNVEVAISQGSAGQLKTMWHHSYLFDT